jgi:ABC-2 type transport system ATP-binding protein
VSTVEIRSVSRWYGNVLGLNRVELEIGTGVTALLGPNGAGKSTLIRLVTGQIHPSTGEILVFDQPPFANPTVASRLGLVPDEDGFPFRVTGIDWVVYLLRLHGFEEDEARRRAEETLGNVRLAEAMHRPAATYSRGMRQRLKLAQAIAHEPDLLVLDEPLAGLDPVGRREMIDWIRDWGRKGKSVLVSSHILHEVELMTREVVLMNQGRVLASGNVHEIRRLIDAHPHRIRLATPDPKSLANRLLGFPGIVSVSFTTDLERVDLETNDPENFYENLSNLVLEEGLTIHEMTSPDDNLEAVFDYVMES